MSTAIKKKYILFGILIVVAGYLFLKVVDVGSNQDKNTNSYTSIRNEKESCFSCHNQTDGFSEHHNPAIIGCTSCHLGNPEKNTKSEAHQHMILIPGNLADADKTCGKCHVNELYKIKHSLMTTNSGLVAVDKFVFGEADNPDGQYHITDIKFTATDKHIRDLCANCHLGAEKKEFGAITELSRGGGCNACHLNYSDAATDDLKKYISSKKEQLPTIHPSTTIAVTDNHCFGCHSRSSRISTNYQGWQETLIEDDAVVAQDNYTEFLDGRIYKYQGDDVHHSKGMLCIDCHSSHEVMGDGKEYLHEEKAVSLTCTDCHFKEKPTTIAYDDLDAESLLVFLHRDYSHTNKKMIAVKKDGHPLVNTYVDDKGDLFLIGKKEGVLHQIKEQGVCARDIAHKNVSCSTCHSQWAPRCIGCHNSFDKKDVNAYDLLDKKDVVGGWAEHVSEFSASKPAMGVCFTGDKKLVEPAVPGMILTIDHQSFDKDSNKKNTFHRLYAPNAPHTITKKVRDCKSCHTNPAAIGYGMGVLKYDVSKGYGEWQFTADYALNANDQLPEDAWIPFLKQQKADVVSTRTDFRPFTIKEQQRILLVGACLQCHKEDATVMKQTLKLGLEPFLLKLSKSCILPKE